MKIDQSEIAPSGKRRLKIYLGDRELEIMQGLVVNALRSLPIMSDTRELYSSLRSMNLCFDQHFQGLEQARTANSVCATVPEIIPKIWFDGGTPCNIPAKGYGDGYGSYRIDQEEIVRLEFKEPMSANTAEVRTVTEAIKAVRLSRPSATWIHVVGDSKIALKWVKCASQEDPLKTSKGSSEKFQQAIEALYEAVKGLDKIVTEWNPRSNMVAIFGH